MARSKGTPERSKLVRGRAVAFARKHKGGDAEEGAEKNSEPEATDPPQEAAQGDAVPVATPVSKTQPVATPDELPKIDPPEPKAEPWPDATPPPMKPVEASEPARSGSRNPTIAMPVLSADLGRPPEMPQTAAPPPLALGSVENPTHLPAARDIPSGSPEDPAPAPGLVPPGDSRSLRRGNEFALVYRVGTCVISRTGTVGTRGQWRVVEYPTSASASSSYAKECSRFVSEGFSDYRD